MPNWCSNDLVVTGDTDSLREWSEQCLDQEVEDMTNEFTWENLLPVPEELREKEGFGSVAFARSIGEKPETTAEQERLLDLYGATSWWDWCVTHWGTKWGPVDSTCYGKDDSSYSVSFDTAWSPPEGAILKMSELFPDLIFVLAFEETGMDFQGIMGVVKGKTVFEKSTECLPSMDYVLDECRDG